MEIRVPLGLRGPGVEQAKIESPTSVLDLHSTLSELVGVMQPGGDLRTGSDLRPAYSAACDVYDRATGSYGAVVRADGLRLAAESTAVGPSDPALALLLSAEGVRKHPHHLTFAALYSAAGSCRGLRTISAKSHVGIARFSPDGKRVLMARSSGGNDAEPAVTVHDAESGRLLASWKGVPLAVGDVAWSPDGKRVAVAVEGAYLVRYTDQKQPEAAIFTDRTVFVFDTDTGKDLVQLRGQHKQRVASVRFSPNGKRLLTGSWDNTARIWDAATGEHLHALEGHEYSLLTAAFSPDGKRVLTVSTGRRHESYFNKEPTKPGQPPALDPGPTDRPAKVGQNVANGSGSLSGGGEEKLARVWDADTGKLIAALTKSRPAATTFGTRWDPTAGTFSPDGKRVAVAFGNSIAAVWDAAGGEEKFTLQGHTSTLHDVTFSPDGNWVATAAADKTARLWDAATGAELLVLRGHQSTVYSVRFSPDRRRLLTASEDRTARVWDATTGDVVARLHGHLDGVRYAAFDPDGKRVVTAGDFTARVWTAGPIPDVPRVIRTHTKELTALAFSPDGAKLLTASKDETARVFDPATGRELLVLGVGRELGEVRHAAFSVDGKWVVTASQTTTAMANGKTINESAVHVWDATTGAERCQLRDHKFGASYATFTQDGERILTITDGGKQNRGGTFPGSRSSSDDAGFVRVWDVATQKLVFQTVDRVEPGSRPVFSAGGRLLLTHPQQGGALLLDGQDGRVRREFSTDQWGASAVDAMSPDGRRVFLGRDMGTLVDAGTGKDVAPLPGRLSRVTLARFSPDSRRLFTAHGRSGHVWDAETGKAVAALSGHESRIVAAEFSHDGRRVVTGSDDATAAVWDAATGALIAVYMGHPGPVRFVAYHPNGETVATGSTDGVVRLWSLDPVADALRRAPRKFTEAEKVRYDVR
ncbi:MAG: hypothetical protein ABGY75_08655 [Gemmataceae bacterium]